MARWVIPMHLFQRLNRLLSPMFGAYGRSVEKSAATFVSKAAFDEDKEYTWTGEGTFTSYQHKRYWQGRFVAQ